LDFNWLEYMTGKRSGAVGNGSAMQTYIAKTGGGINNNAIYTPPYLKARHT